MAAYYPPGVLVPSKLHLYLAEFKKPEFEPRGVFPFFDLPGEIRNRIYDLTFEDCLVDVRLGQQHSSCNETRDGSSFAFQKLPLESPQPIPWVEKVKLSQKQPDGRKRPMRPRPTAKKQTQSLSLEQEQPRSEQQKGSRNRQKGRRGAGQGPMRMSHQVLSPEPSCADENQNPYQIPFNFLQASRQMYGEGLCFMYRKTAFRLTSAKVMSRFLAVTPLRALQSIQGLNIVHETHGEPKLTKDRYQKLAFDKKWLMVCKQSSEKMRNLKKLRLRLKINDWPCQLTLAEDWALPILALRGEGLDFVEVSLLHAAFNEARLSDAERNLEITMMNPKGRMARLQQEKMMVEARKKKAKSKSYKVLVIKMDSPPAAPKVQKA